MKMVGLKEVKKEQRRAIHDFVSGRDVLCRYQLATASRLLPAVFGHLRSSIDDLCFAADCRTNAGFSLRCWWSLALLCW